MEFDIDDAQDVHFVNMIQWQMISFFTTALAVKDSLSNELD